MGREAARLQDLCRVTEALWLASGQELRGAVAQVNALEAQLAALEAQRAEALRAAAADPAQYAHLSKWLRWADQGRKRLNRALARARITLEIEQKKARRDFGRTQAMQRIRQDLDTADRRRRAKAEGRVL